MSQSPTGLGLSRALAGAVFAWAWVEAALFVGQERIMGDVSQSLMLGGAAVALALFAALDLTGKRGPELGRTAMRAIATVVSAYALIMVVTPAGNMVPAAIVSLAWVAYGVVGAFAQRRTLHLLASLARAMSGRQLLGVACGILALSTLLALMAARMSVTDGAVFMLTSAALAIWLLPQGKLAFDAASETGASGQQGKANARLLGAFAFMFAAMGFTCGFHTSVGRVLYSTGTKMSTVFLVLFATCAVCALIARHTRRSGSGVPAVALRAPLACACVAFVPLLFLNDRPDDLLWELFQNSLVALSTCALLASLSMAACAEGTAGKPRAGLDKGRRTAPYCAVALAAFALGLFAGWLAGQGAYDAGGAAGMAFRLSVTACIALLVAAILVSSNPMAQGALAAQEGPGAREGETVEATGAGEVQITGGKVGETGETTRTAAIPGAGEVASTNQQAESGAQATCSAAEAGAAGAKAPQDPYGPFCERYGLSERERVLLGLLARGLNTQQAADELCVSRNTVKSHMAHIYTKCGVHTRAELDELLGQGGN